jgi:hypothetical protein
VFPAGRFQIRSWVFIYLGLIAAFVLAGPHASPGATSTDLNRAPIVIADSQLLRRDI